MRASTWRNALLGNVNELRSRMLQTPNIELLPIDEISRDLNRTFPHDKWFNEHHIRIRNVLLWYAWTNPGLSYCQAFSFIAFSLYNVFHKDDPKHSMVDTYYAMHKLITIVRPIYPLNSGDSSPLSFAMALRSLIHLNLLTEDKELANRVMEHDIVHIYIANGVPTLFTNWFDLNSGHIVLGYIIDVNKEKMFNNVINFLTGFILAYKPIYMSFDTENLLVYVRHKQIFAVGKIIAAAKRL
jgi:hypothetical protein